MVGPYKQCLGQIDDSGAPHPFPESRHVGLTPNVQFYDKY